MISWNEIPSAFKSSLAKETQKELGSSLNDLKLELECSDGTEEFLLHKAIIAARCDGLLPNEADFFQKNDLENMFLYSITIYILFKLI